MCFFDCWYKDKFIATKNNFLNGTNLLGKPHNIPVTFNVKTNIMDNILITKEMNNTN